MDLTAEEINNSIHFQLSRGGNCIGEFKKMESLLDRFIEKKLDAAYLNNILGKYNNENVALNEHQYNYHLTEKSDGCSVNLVIKDANLVSYSFVNCK